MEKTAQNQSNSPTKLSQALIDASLMFEQLSPETQKALIELMRQFVAKNGS